MNRKHRPNKSDSAGKPIPPRRKKTAIQRRSLPPKRAANETALRESEQMLADAQRIARIGSWRWDIRTGDLQWSEELFSIYEVDPRTFKPSIDSFAKCVYSGDRTLVEQKIVEITSSGGPIDFEFRIVTGKGSTRLIRAVGQVTEFDTRGRPRVVVGANQDVTERNRTAERLASDVAALTRMHALSTQLLESHDIEALLQEIMDAAVAITESDKGTLQLLEGDSLRIVAHHGHTQRFLDFFAAAEHVASVCGESSRRGERLIIEDVETSPLFAGTESQKVLRAAGVRTIQSTPLVARDGRLLGILTTQWSQPCIPDEHALWRLDLLARQAADLIERKRTQEELRKSEELFRVMFMKAAVGKVQVAPQTGRFLRVNPAFCRLTGYSEQELLQRSFLEITHPDDRESDQAKFQAMVQGQTESFESEKRYISADGRVVWAHVAVNMVLGAIGEPLYSLAVIQDITARKQAEAAKFEINERLRALMDALPVGVSFSNDATCRAITGNPAVLAQFEISEDDNLSASAPNPTDAGRQVRFFSHGKPLTDQDLPLQQAVALNCAVPTMELEIHLPSGRVWFADASAAPIRDTEGNVVGGVAVTVDITQRKRAEGALRQARDELEIRIAERTEELRKRTEQLRGLVLQLTQAEEAERRRVAQVLHDGVQQLLASVRFHTEFIVAESKLDRVQDMARNATAIIEEALAATRSLTAELCPSVLQSPNVSENLRWLARWMEEHHHLNVRVSAQEILVEPQEMRELIFRAVRELLFNVVKHAAVLVADVALSQEERRLKVVVSDQGRGCDPQQFESYRKDGGFGLMSVGERVELCGGQWHVETSPGQGMTVTLIFPHVPAKRSRTKTVTKHIKPPSTPLRTMAHASGRKLCAIIVDDHQVSRNGVRGVLERHAGIEVVGEAESGATGLDLVRTLQPDIVIMDLNLPDMSGIEVTRQIHAEWPTIRIIGLSMHEEGERAEAMHAAGACGFVSKSAPVSELIDSLRRFCEETKVCQDASLSFPTPCETPGD